MVWIVILLIIGWPLSGLLAYLGTAMTVNQLTGDWLVNCNEDERFNATMAFLALGPFAYFAYRQHRRQAETRLNKRQEAERVRLLFGPSELDGYQQCCELKQAVLLEKTRLDEELAELKLRPDPDAYVREYFPELAKNASPAQVRQEQIATLTEKLDNSLRLTEERIAVLAEAQRQREAEKAELRRLEEKAEAEDRIRQAKLERQREEAEAEAHWQAKRAEAEARLRAEEAAAVSERLSEQARLKIDQQAAADDRQAYSHLSGMNVRLAESLWRHRSNCLNLGSFEYPDWIQSAAELAVALQNHKKLRKKYGRHKRRICDWLASELGDSYFASLMADTYNHDDEPGQVGQWLNERLRYALRVSSAYEAELDRLKLAWLNDRSDQDGADPIEDEPSETGTEGEAAQAEGEPADKQASDTETPPTNPLTGEPDKEPDVLFSTKNLDDLARGKIKL